MQIIIKNKDTLLCDNFKFKCCIGKNGLSAKKAEGDKKTPKGLFKLGPVYFRKDRLAKPMTKLKTIEIKKNMGWCDDINNKFYNKLVKIKKKIKCEKLFRESENYNILIPIHYNYVRPIKKKGSAIFLHLTDNYKKTLGCVALKESDMLILLKLINKKTKIKIN
tara:strand:- start:134 stop:625 length:492 start_codon:yes stop_codon:yes gene_type:complete